MTTFIEGVKTPVKGLVQSANGLPYLPWPTAIALSGRPDIRVAQFGEDGDPFLAFFDGLVVAVDAGDQRVWLPVLDGRNQPISPEKGTSRDVTDTINRARCKAVAMVHGVGMSLYAGYGENVAGFLRDLGVRPDSDLAQVEPLTAQKPGRSQATYVDWAAAYTAAKLTDPEFSFRVHSFAGIPAKRLLDYWAVAVTVRHSGREHTEWLPMMGVFEVQTKNGLRKLDHQPLANPTVHDWNRAVMRCMTKAVAVCTGYGLSVYAREDIEALHREPIGTARATEPASEAPVTDSPEAPSDLPTEPVSTQKARPEPSPEEHERLLKRIENISALESVDLARQHLAERFAGTQALSQYRLLLDAKAADLSAESEAA